MLSKGEQLRDTGIEQVLSGKDAYKQEFDEVADMILKCKGRVTAPDVTEIVGMPPGHRNAIGAAMRRFALARGLTIVEYIKCNRPERHAGRIAVWA